MTAAAHQQVNSPNSHTLLHCTVLQVLSKLITTAGTDVHVSTHLLGCLEVLASPAMDPQAVAVCEGVLATKPPLVPWLLKQLEQSAGGPGLAGAALGKHLLHFGMPSNSLEAVGCLSRSGYPCAHCIACPTYTILRRHCTLAHTSHACPCCRCAACHAGLC